MAPRRSSPRNLLITVLHANREHRRDAYATLGSASCLKAVLLPQTPIHQYADPPTRFPSRRPILNATKP